MLTSMASDKAERIDIQKYQKGSCSACQCNYFHQLESLLGVVTRVNEFETICLLEFLEDFGMNIGNKAASLPSP